MRSILILLPLLVILSIPVHAADWVIIVGKYSFDPEPLTISLGDTVHWIWNSGSVQHSVTSDPRQLESWNSGLRSSEDEDFVFDHTFTHLGAFTYNCNATMGMCGTVIVMPVASSSRNSSREDSYQSWLMFIGALIRQIDEERMINPAPARPVRPPFHMAGWG